MLAFNPSSLTLSAVGHQADELTTVLLKFASVGHELGIDLLSARPPMHPIAETLRDEFSIEERKLLVNLHHEIDHATVHLSTSFGAISNVIDQLFIYITANRIIEMAENPSTLLSWLSDPDRCGEAAAAKSRDDCDETTFDALCLRSLSSALLGRPGMVDRDKVTRGLDMLYSYLDSDGKSSSGDLRIGIKGSYRRFLSEQDPLHPYHCGKPVGATAIIEGQAIFIQEYELEMLQLPKRELIELLGNNISDYSLTQSLWLEFFDHLPLKDPIRAWEYLWVLGLALWIPLYPVADAGFERHNWDDLHPGWRFIKICAWLSSSGYQFLDDDATEEEASEREHDFNAMVCGALGWMSQKEIAIGWLTPQAEAVTLRLYAERDEAGTYMHPRMRYIRSNFNRMCYGRTFDLSAKDLAHFPMAVIICEDSGIMLPFGCWVRYDTFTGNSLLRFKEYTIYEFARYWALGGTLSKFLWLEGVMEFTAYLFGDAICKCTGSSQELRATITDALNMEIRRILG